MASSVTKQCVFFFQFLLQSYAAGFSHANRNASSEQVVFRSTANLTSCFNASMHHNVCVYLSPSGEEDVFKTASADCRDRFLHNMCGGVYNMITHVKLEKKQLLSGVFVQRLSLSFVTGPASNFDQSAQCDKLTTAGFFPLHITNPPLR